MHDNINMAAIEDGDSSHSSNSSLDLEDEDRRYLEALRDRNHVATKTTRHPLGLFSVVLFILQQMIGSYPSISRISQKLRSEKALEYSKHPGLLCKLPEA
jgi:hypothetical protein